MAMAYINQQGRTSSAILENEAALLLTWVVENLQALSAVHVAGKDNVAANYLSWVCLDTGE